MYTQIGTPTIIALHQKASFGKILLASITQVTQVRAEDSNDFHVLAEDSKDFRFSRSQRRLKPDGAIWLGEIRREGDLDPRAGV
jgi:hypothetical protein